MCGRFVASSSPEEVRRWFRTTNRLPNFGPSFNVAPTDSIPVVRFNPKTRERSLDLLHWGLIPRFAKDRSGAYKLINARAESIDTKPSFHEAFAQHLDDTCALQKPPRPRKPGLGTPISHAG